MAFAFDTLGDAKKLRDAGIPSAQAEAHAEAARDFVMHKLVNRYDLQAVKDDLGTVRRGLQIAIDTTRRELAATIDTMRCELEATIDRLSLRLTIRIGVMLAAGLSILDAVLKIHQ
jgi:hypothetical protein